MTSVRSKIKPELLAPAGNLESFYGVLNAGADAVYMAGNRFGARAYADNFTDEEIIGCIRYAHLYKKKIYLTVNTLIKNEEMNDLVLFLTPLYNAGLDGVIVQDLGVLNVLKSTFPKLLLHASTQLSVTGEGACAFLKDLGVCRVVPARELDLSEISRIKETGIEVECFIHGAMCYSYSGQCLFSSCLGGRSGNRGRCAQPCRLPYCLEGSSKEIYPLSLKDMQTVDLLPELIEAGIDSFKIEGRMKKPEYAAGVTAIYRKYIDEYFKKGSINVSDRDRKVLNSLYIRSEVSGGYYHKYNGPDMISINSPSYSGTDEEVLNDIRRKFLGDSAERKLKKIRVTFTATFVEGEDASITAEGGGAYAFATGKTVETASSRPISEGDVLKSLGKLGNTVFCLNGDNDGIRVVLSGSPYYSLKDINELRRSVIEELEEIILQNNGYSHLEDGNSAASDNAPEGNESVKKAEVRPPSKRDGANTFAVSVNDISQLKKLLDKNIKGLSRIYITEKMYTCDKDLFRILSECDVPVFIQTAFIRRDRKKHLREYVLGGLKDKSIKGVCVRNLEDLKFFYDAKLNGSGFEIICDAPVYSWNMDTIDVLDRFSDCTVLPLELSAGAHKELLRSRNCHVFEKVIYGRYPLMQSANCIFNTSMNCQRKKPEKTHWTLLKDRTGRNIPVMADCLHCHNTVYNTVPLSIYKLSDYMSFENCTFRIDLTDEDDAKTDAVLDYYSSLIAGNISEHPDWEYTTGFEKKSTE